MDIGEAVHRLKSGSLLRRANWNGKNMHIYMEDVGAFSIGVGVFKGQGAYKGQKGSYKPYLVLVTPSGSHQPGWVCSQEDLLAEDWEVVVD